MKRTILLLFLSFLSFTQLSAQTEPSITIILLGNDKIADVNMDQDNFIKYVGEITDLAKKEFATIPESQKIAVLIIAHKSGKPTLEVYSNPKLATDKESKFLSALSDLKSENTKIVDFPLMLTVNSKFEEIGTDFKNFTSPGDKMNEEYEKADLKKKYELNKAYAINEVLPVLAAYETTVDDKFAGVKNFGKLVAKTNFNETQDIAGMTSKNYDYWRATMEMDGSNQLIPITKIAIMVSQGEFDYAQKYIEMISMFADSKTISATYLKEMRRRLSLFDNQLNGEINKGIAEHDKGNYEKAIAAYNDILKIYPNSAWANYELYYSQNALDAKLNKTDLSDRTSWDIAKVKVYENNPLYHLDVRASNGREMYLMFRRQEIGQLFQGKEVKVTDIYKYADIAMDLDVKDFAAQLFWLTNLYDKKDENSLYKYLYCIEKLGVTTLKDNFKGDFDKEFKKIEKAKEKEMTSNSMYKAAKDK